MGKLHFYIEKRLIDAGQDIDRQCPLILSFSYSSSRIKVYTGRKVSENEWDTARERLKPIYAKAEELNAYLDRMNDRIHKAFDEISNLRGFPSHEVFRTEIKRMLRHDIPGFFDLLLHFIEENHSHWSLTTYRKMRTFYSQLEEFSAGSERRLTAASVGQEFADRLIAYYRSKGLRDSSIKKNIDLLKWAMNWGLKKGYIFNTEFRNIIFTPSDNLTGKREVFLRWDELVILFRTVGLTRKEEWARDIFCFISFTGIRFSKIGLLKRENWNGRYFQSGTKESDIVVLNRFASEICLKYEHRFYRNNAMFPPASLITFHRHIRSAAKKAGINRNLFNSELSVYEPVFTLLSAQAAMNTYYACLVILGSPQSMSRKPLKNSAMARILDLSGSIKLAETKQLTTSDKLYESLTGTGNGT
jgi:integrase